MLQSNIIPVTKVITIVDQPRKILYNFIDTT